MIKTYKREKSFICLVPALIAHQIFSNGLNLLVNIISTLKNLRTQQGKYKSALLH